MSIRTIVEINHDYLHDLINEVESGLGHGVGDLISLLRALRSSATYESSAVRVLGSRHHSETLRLEVK